MPAKVIGVYSNELEVIEVIKSYESEGVDPKSFSVFAKDENKTEHITDEVDVSERNPINKGAFGIIGGFLAGIGGGFFVPGLLNPGLGPIIAAGPMAASISGGSYDEVKNMFTSAGINVNSADKYIEELNKGKIILFLED